MPSECVNYKGLQVPGFLQQSMINDWDYLGNRPCNHRKLKKALEYLTLILLLSSCSSDKKSVLDDMPTLYSAPQAVALNTEEGYFINPVIGDSIQPLINSLGEPILTGVPVPVKGKIIPPESVSQSIIVPAGEPELCTLTIRNHI